MKKALLTGLFVGSAGVVSCMDMVKKVVNTDNAVAVTKALSAGAGAAVAMNTFTKDAPQESGRVRQYVDKGLYFGAVGGSAVAAGCSSSQVQVYGTILAGACGVTRRLVNGAPKIVRNNAHQLDNVARLENNKLMVGKQQVNVNQLSSN